MRTDELYTLVESTLSKSEESCNDDKCLIFNIFKELGCFSKEADALIIKQSQLSDLPSFESIRRIRQKIQNEEGRFLPTYGNVLVKRGFTEQTVRSIFGESSKTYQAYIFIKTEGARSKVAYEVATV